MNAWDEALALQRRAAAEGFDWQQVDALWAKLTEEIDELRAALRESPARQQDELGDILFMLVNIARHLQLDPDAALRGSCARFGRRFAYVMAEPESLPSETQARLMAMEARWAAAKQLERGAGDPK